MSFIKNNLTGIFEVDFQLYMSQKQYKQGSMRVLMQSAFPGMVCLVATIPWAVFTKWQKY